MAGGRENVWHEHGISFFRQARSGFGVGGANAADIGQVENTGPFAIAFGAIENAVAAALLHRNFKLTLWHRGIHSPYYGLGKDRVLALCLRCFDAMRCSQDAGLESIVNHCRRPRGSPKATSGKVVPFPIS